MGAATAHSLYTLNAQSGERIFSLDENADPNYVYHIDGSLDQTAVGSMRLIGNAAGTQIISGAIVDASGALTGAHGSLFAIGPDATATLFAQDITLADAAGANGALLSQNNVDAISYFQNTTIQNNTATANGGAIYNNAGAASIIDKGSITGNTAGTDGGAIYNNATLNLVASSGNSITFANNTANGIANDIYNAGAMNITGAGVVNINSGISGSATGVINMAGEGAFNINADSSAYVGQFAQTNGTTNATANFFSGANNIYGGELNFNGVGAQIGGTLNVAGGLVALNDSASLSNAIVDLTAGRLDMSDAATTSNANFNISNGTLVVDAGAAINGGAIAMTGGQAAIAGSLNSNTTTIADGVLAMQTGGRLAGGTLALNGGGLSWAGVKQSNAQLLATGGTMVVKSGSDLTLNNANDRIDAAAQFYVESGATLHNAAGNITIGRDDLIAGVLHNDAAVSFNGGAYDYSATAGGSFVQSSSGAVANILGGAQMTLGANAHLTGGAINIGGDGTGNSVLAVAAVASFAADIALNINADNHFVVNGGTATLDGGDALNGTIDLLSGDLYFGNASLNGALVASGGAMHIQSGALDFGTNTAVASDVRIMLSEGAQMNINDGAAIEINNDDSLSGRIALNNGKMIFNGLTKTDDFEIDITGGTISLINGANWTAHGDDASTAQTNIEIDNSILNIMAGSSFNNFASVSIKNGGALNAMSGAAEEYNLGTLVLDGGTANFSMDIADDDAAHDVFNIDSVVGAGTINISNARMLSAPKDLTMTLNVFRVGQSNARMSRAAAGSIAYTTSVGVLETAIYNYRFASNNDGTYTLTRAAEDAEEEFEAFNPTVFRGQSSATALLGHEMSITNMVFDHIYLDTRGCKDCGRPDAPYFARRNGAWVKPFYVSETLAGHKRGGGDVDSDFYGTIAGFDMRPMSISSKLRLRPSVYGAYTGSKTANIQQSGIRLGAMGTLTDGAFGTTLMLYVGMHESKMDLEGITDTASMNFVGGAIKSAYDFRLGNLIVQPNAIVGYKIMGRQKWDTDFGNITMETDAFDGVNAAGGVSLIYAADDWSAYALGRWMVQLDGCEVKSRADGVELPAADACRDYAEFGLGASASLSDRWSGFLQATGTAGGRVGASGKMGLNWKF
jgi:hypothetical protein